MADEARDATFLLTGAGMWVGKLAYFTADPLTTQEGRRAMDQAVSNNRVKVRRPGHPHVNLLAQQPFWFNVPRNSLLKDMPGDGGSDYQPSPYRPSIGCKCNRRWRDQRPQLPRFPLPSPDCGFESDRSSLLMASSMSSRSDHSDRSRHST